MFNKIDFCQVCRHYDIVGNKCSIAPGRAIPKSECADYEFHTHGDLCKYCSHNNYGRCTVSGHKCNASPILMNVCADFENKKVMDKRIERICERCTLKCANEDCEAIRKRFEKLLRAIQDFANVFNKD